MPHDYDNPADMGVDPAAYTCERCDEETADGFTRTREGWAPTCSDCRADMPAPSTPGYDAAYRAAWDAAMDAIAAHLSDQDDPYGWATRSHADAARDAVADIYKRLCDPHGTGGDVRAAVTRAAIDAAAATV